jgi:hypothetical protein
MESTKQKGQRTYKGGARDVASASAALRRIVRAGHAEAGLAGIDIHVKGDPQEPGVAYCVVDIHGDTQADAEQIAAQFEDDGWTCQSSGPTDVRCESPD